MGRYYNRNKRWATFAELQVVDRMQRMRSMPSRMTLASAVVKENWNPVKVLVSGSEHPVTSWADAYAIVAKQLVGLFPDKVAQFVADMGVPWICKSDAVSMIHLSLGDGWITEIASNDSILVARLKMLVAGIGLSPSDILFVFPNDECREVKKKIESKPVLDNTPPPNLDAAQKRFIESSARNVRLLAPAGAGKTLTVLHRCKELLSRNKNAKILLVTFTRVARDELKIRLASRPEFTGIEDRVVVTTLNQYGYKLLKKRFAACRLVTETKDKKFILGNQLRIVAPKSRALAKNIDSKAWLYKNSARILDLMDAFKTLGMDHRTITSHKAFEVWCKKIMDGELRELYLVQVGRMIGMKLLPEGEPQSISPKAVYDGFIRFHCAACETLMTMNLFTIEDQKYWGWLSLKDAARVNGAARYTQIMVDEFQDINPVDMQFVAALAKQHNADLTLVGDDDQTIFEWRGATPAYILNPDVYFAAVNDGGTFETFILERNYRSPKNVVEISQKLISHNKVRVQKNVSAVQTGNADIRVVKDVDYEAISQMIIDDVVNPDIRNIALISRKKSQLIPYQIIFASRQVDFYAAEDLNVFLTDAFRALRSLILIKTRQNAGGVSATDMVDDVLLLINHIHRYPLSRADTALLRSNLLAGYFQTYHDLVNELRHMPGIGKFKDFVEASDILQAFFDSVTVDEMLDCVSCCFSGFKQDFQKADDDIFYADPPFAELAAFSRRYDADFKKFYADVELTVSTLASVVRVTDESDAVSEQSKEAFQTKLHLMTALRTKGREFDSVYVLRTNADTWPIKKASTEGRLEAERRLFYVAVTRAKKRLLFIREPGNASPYLREMGFECEEMEIAKCSTKPTVVSSHKVPYGKTIPLWCLKLTITIRRRKKSLLEWLTTTGASHEALADAVKGSWSKGNISRVLRELVEQAEVFNHKASSEKTLPLECLEWSITIRQRQKSLLEWLAKTGVSREALADAVKGSFTKDNVTMALRKLIEPKDAFNS